MVGVPGKSKGCKTCRKRKIACDLQRPVCANCIKSKRTCLGYDKDVRFIPVRASLTDEKLVVTSSFKTPSQNTIKSHEETQTLQKTSGLTDGISVSSGSRRHRFSLFPASDLLCGLANRQQLLSVFVAACIPTGAGGVIDPSKGWGGPWMLQLPQLFMKTPALQTAVSAIAASILGRQHDDRDFVNESLRFYTSGLRELQKSLWDPHVMFNDEILAVCLCLDLYEAMECLLRLVVLARQAYYNHCMACMRLVEARGAGRHVSGVSHELFLGLRAQGLPVKPLWMTMPWKLRPKRAIDRLVDCLCEASTIFQENDRIQRLGPVEKLESWLESLAKCWKMDSTLQDVYKEYETDFPQPMYWSVLSKETNSADDSIRGKVFPVAYRFPNMTVARSLMLYWAISLLICNGLSLLYQGIASLEFDAGDSHCSNFPECELFYDNMCHCRYLRLQPLGSYKYDISHFPSLGHRADPRISISDVCQSIEYCFDTDIAVWGTWSAGTPLTLVYETVKYLPGLEREVRWMEATLRKLQGRGLRILNYTTTFNQPRVYS
ncbi:conserved hypothetical protein [Talaromyces marneffei ATCC 18224]|uniref:Zn(2)-C6 fungal-type domain-containing protein n=1 Tax=Talaromyces marneffei (strain ATCC 18224 / CBS 334.59 / QM 7333) TaxID=441960 RepID=B6Q726_TALMQ|nr:conserved hypothetical protein [Talaromyces marneffei ATCC 18224]